MTSDKNEAGYTVGGWGGDSSTSSTHSSIYRLLLAGYIYLNLS
jgi:hypothetical protein